MAPIICPSCKNPAPLGAIFCDNCGYDLRAIPAVSDKPIRPVAVPGDATLNILLCSNCGYENQIGSVFCENCGTQLPKQKVGNRPGPVPVNQGVQFSQPASPQPSSPQLSSPQPSSPQQSPLKPSIPQPLPPIAPSPQDDATLIGKSSAQSPSKAAPESVPGRLVIPGKNISIPIPPSTASIIIGREDPVSGIFPDIDLDPHGGHDAGVGRRHAQLSIQGSDVFIEDLDSVNGTAVNKQKLSPRSPHRIVNGDELRFGKLILVYMDK